jgi:hypothetical protein
VEPSGHIRIPLSAGTNFNDGCATDGIGASALLKATSLRRAALMSLRNAARQCAIGDYPLLAYSPGHAEENFGNVASK